MADAYYIIRLYRNWRLHSISHAATDPTRSDLIEAQILFNR